VCRGLPVAAVAGGAVVIAGRGCQCRRRASSTGSHLGVGLFAIGRDGFGSHVTLAHLFQDTAKITPNRRVSHVWFTRRMALAFEKQDNIVS
jgi:hypothetical protein